MSPQKKQEIRRRLPPMKIENAKLIYKNFAGAAKKYNLAGYRNFHVVLDTETARVMEQDGWNVRWHDPRDEADEAWASIKVAVRFDNYPPRIVLVDPKNGRKTELDEESVDILDWASIAIADLVITASPWEANGKTGYKAYLNKLFVTLDEDDLEAKYSAIQAHSRAEDGSED